MGLISCCFVYNYRVLIQLENSHPINFIPIPPSKVCILLTMNHKCSHCNHSSLTQQVSTLDSEP